MQETNKVLYSQKKKPLPPKLEGWKSVLESSLPTGCPSKSFFCFLFYKMHRAFQTTNTEASVLKRCARTTSKGASTQSRPSLPDLDEWLSRKRIQHKHFKNKNRFRLLGQNQTQCNFFSVFFTTRRTFGKTAPFYDSFQLESLFAGYLRFSLGVGN